MPKRLNPLKAAAWGAGVGAIAVSIDLAFQPSLGPVAELVGQYIGAVAGGGILFSLAAAIRNRVTGN